MKQNNISPRLTVGLDLSDRTLRYCEVDRQGKTLKQGEVKMTRDALQVHLKSYKRPVRVMLETGGQSAWVSQLAEALGHEVFVVNARELKAVTGRNRRSDEQDAWQLARLGNIDPQLLNPVKLRDRSQQADLCIVRARAGLVEARTQLINMARCLAKQFGQRLPSSGSGTFVARAREAMAAELKAVLDGLLNSIEQISADIQNYDEAIATMAETRYPETRWLSQVPGVGTLTAVTFRLTLGDVDRFAHSRDVGAYLGMVPKRRQSGEQDPQLGISKAGDVYLRKLLVQCAHHLMGRFGVDCALRQWALGRVGKSRAAKKRIVVAVARKLAVLLHGLWKRQETFQAFPVVQQAA